MVDSGLVALQDAPAAGAADEAAVAAGATWRGLMATAAGHLCRGVVAALDGRVTGRRVLVLAGPGNNGGDGWAVAPLLARRGALVEVVAPGGLDRRMSDEATGFRAAWRSGGGRVGDATAVAEALARADVAVDALLGTGASGPLRGDVGEAATLLGHVRATRGPRRADAGLLVVAADVPSGVDASTGVVASGAPRADLTVTFGGPKVGHVLAPGRDHVGRLVVGSLGPAHVAPPTRWQATTAAAATPPPLAPSDDKRARGRVLVVAGALDTSGAAVLTTRGALAMGAGLVTAAVPAPVRATVAGLLPAAMTRALPADDDGALAEDAGGRVLEVAGIAGEGGPDLDAVVVGPGCGHGAGTRAVVEALLPSQLPLVLDADALNVFRGDPGALRSHAGVVVVTPHDRELRRLADGRDVPADAHGRAEVAARVADDLGVVVVAKGPTTVVVAPGGRRVVVPVGGPELGVGGTGDLLAGMVAAALARARPVVAHDAVLPVARACHLHSLAGVLAGARGGPRPTTAAVADAIPEAARTLEELAAADPTHPFDASLRSGTVPPPRRGGDGVPAAGALAVRERRAW